MSMGQQGNQPRGDRPFSAGASATERRPTPGYPPSGPAKPNAPSSPTSTPPNLPNVADEAQQKVGQAVDQVRQQGMSQLATQKDRVAGTVGSVAHALRETGKQLKQGDDAPVAEYVDRVADTVEQFSNHIRQRDVDELVHDAESFARRQPALFLGGAFFLGVVAARFLRSSPPDEPRSNQTDLWVPGTPRNAAIEAPYSWQTGENQPGPAKPLVSTGSPTPGQPMGNGPTGTDTSSRSS